MQIVAQGWVVYNLTDSALMLGLVNFVALVPVLPISLISGVLSDRFSRRNLMLITETILLIQALVMAILIYLGVLQIWHVILLSFILGAAASMEQPARLAIVVDIVGKENLSNAVALNSSAYNTARIIGPAIAGLVIASFGEAACFMINSVTYLALIVALILIRIPLQNRSNEHVPLVGGLKDGFEYIKGNKVILGLFLIISIASFLTIPYVALMPVFARDVLTIGAKGLGFLLTAVGVGAILGALLVAYLREGSRGNLLLMANIAGPIFLLGFAFAGNLPLSLLLVVSVGASNAIRLTLANSLTQLNTRDEFHGRVMSIFNLLFNGLSRVGALVIGGLAEVTSISWALGAGAALSVGLGLVFIFRMPHIRRLP
jgi:MFS family permease